MTRDKYLAMTPDERQALAERIGPYTVEMSRPGDDPHCYVTTCPRLRPAYAPLPSCLTIWPAMLRTRPQ